jgi:4-hydroxy-tetrahydrodipicolinate synthase
MKPDFHGVYPAMTTQFRPDHSLDLDATADHIERMIGSGVHGLVMLGSLGENVALNREEKLQVLRCALEVAKGRVPVISGVAEYGWHQAIDYVAAAEKAGVHGFMLMPAMVYHADREEAHAHFLNVAQSTDLPFIAYNNPIGYHVDLTPEDFKVLSDQSNIVAIKESSGDTRRFTQLANAVGDRYVLMAGVDDLALECTILGAKGWIAGMALAYPHENAALWDLMMGGHWDEARDLYRWFSPLLRLDIGRKFVQQIKLAIQLRGMGSETVRPPRLPLSKEERAHVHAVLEEAEARRAMVGALSR